MKNMLKQRPRHNRSNNRMGRNFHPNNRHHDPIIEEHLSEDERLDYRPARSRITLQQYIEKYIAQARDALSSGDRIQAENYFQHADHFTRLLNEQKAVRQQIENKKQLKEEAFINELQSSDDKEINDDALETHEPKENNQHAEKKVFKQETHDSKDDSALNNSTTNNIESEKPKKRTLRRKTTTEEKTINEQA